MKLKWINFFNQNHPEIISGSNYPSPFSLSLKEFLKKGDYISKREKNTSIFIK